VRIAVETGTPLVPVYHFGNSALFRCVLWRVLCCGVGVCWLRACSGCVLTPPPLACAVAALHCCSWVAPAWLEWVCRRARLAVGYPKGRWGTLMPMR
jgi:hypothetical protein